MPMTIAQRTDAILQLYKTMPGAPMPSKEAGFYMWGDVEGNKHWQFCEQIVDTIRAAADVFAPV